MKRILSTAFLMCIIALMSTLVTVVHATPPMLAEGTWEYLPYRVDVTKVADGNTFKYGEEYGWWTGTFEGTSNDVFTVVVHPLGFVTVEGLINFDGSVNGHEGSLVIRFVGKKEMGQWYGQWVILSGTDDLANLHGQGNWWGPGYLGNGVPGNL